MTTNDTPRVWIGCLASYNAGRLIGEWVDATDTDVMNEAQERVAKQAVTAAKEAGEYPIYFGEPEEFFNADYDNFPSAIVSELGEYPSRDTVAKFATLIEDKGFTLVEAAANAIDDVSELDEDWIDTHHRGEWESEEDYARYEVNELGWSDVPAHIPMTGAFGVGEVILKPFEELDSYLDWESIARAIFQHGDKTFTNGHVFEEGC